MRSTLILPIIIIVIIIVIIAYNELTPAILTCHIYSLWDVIFPAPDLFYTIPMDTKYLSGALTSNYSSVDFRIPFDLSWHYSL